jgi:type IV secretory pathway VirJ component
MKEKEFRAQGASAREKKGERKAKSQTSARLAVLKGTGLTLHLQCRARRVSKTFAHSRARPSETAARNHDASTPAMCRLAENEHGLDGAVTSVTSAEMPAPTTSPTLPLRPKLPQQNLQDRNGY